MNRRLTRTSAALVLVAALAGCQTAQIDTAGVATDLSAGRTPAERSLSFATEQFDAGNYGLAEEHFRQAVVATPLNATAWLGLAAAYDQLGRFDLADRAYAELLRLEGRRASILNNQGYSMILRGDLAKARTILAEARRMVPDNTIIEGNWALANAEG